ncbi:DUF1631 family protein [Aliikangiella sp. G2MR2-5]|uniref:DUF1631 family protein n=1 Tax=Aliikangiella sp. G2MR2-5 TaxID=2788943 RepID=UPI0018AA5CC4|nr:DUF1631 family protein [Aliikangiella sp. G2MR2-5]
MTPQDSTDTHENQALIKSLYAWKLSGTHSSNNELSELTIQCINQIAIKAQFEDLEHVILYFHKQPEFRDLFKEVPTVLEIGKLIQRLFLLLGPEKIFSKAVTKSLGRLRGIFFKISIIDEDFLTKSTHRGRLYLSSLNQLGISLSEENEICRELDECISSLCREGLKSNSKTSIENTLKTELASLNELISDIEKRARIFEKRSKETAQGQAKITIAKNWAKKRLEELKNNFTLPKVIDNMLTEHWFNVLYLEHLKGGDEESSSEITAKRVIVSLQPVKYQEQLDKFLILKSSLPEDLLHGFSLTTISESELEELLQALHLYHEGIEKSARNQIKEGSTEKIVRLQPMSLEKQEKLAEERALLQEQLERIRVQSVNEWVDSHFENDVKETPITKEPINNSLYLNEKILDKLKIGSWFDLHQGSKTLRCKLLSFQHEMETSLFVNFQGQKVLEATNEELVELLEKKRLVQLIYDSSFDSAYEKSLALSRMEKKQQEQEEKIKQEMQKKEKDKKIAAEKAQQEALKVKRLERKILVQDAQLKVENIAIGSWLELEQDNKTIRCRLAARLKSSNCLILTDRLGVKIMEASNEQIAELLVDEKIRLSFEGDVLEKTIATVLTESRMINQGKG